MTSDPDSRARRPALRACVGPWFQALLAGWLLWSGPAISAAAAAAATVPWLSPTALAVTPDGQTMFVACGTANRVLAFEPAARRIARTFDTVAPASGLALSPDGRRLYVTCVAPASEVSVFDVAGGNCVARLAAGHTAMGPVPSPDGRTLFVCNRFNNDVSEFDLASGREVRRIAVAREPVAAAITPEGRYLLVANHLPAGQADADQVAATISVIDVVAGKVIKELTLPSGSGSLHDLRISPDGRYAVATHILARFHLPTTQLERGWMNTNAETIIDLQTLSVLNTVLLDDVDSGAANPWGIAWSADSRTQVVAHAGTHEVSLIDFPALLAKLARVPAEADPARDYPPVAASRVQADVPNDLSFLHDVRRRVKLPAADRGPRAVAVVGSTVYAANYFSDSLTAIDTASPVVEVTSVPLGERPVVSLARKGELLFHDASLCFQTWQSCASCHPGEAREDGFNWDLLNDGIGNPKNNRSLLLAHRTPPMMSLGVRETAEMAVRAGIRHILFTVQPDDVGQAIDEYLKSLRPVPSPRLQNGELSPAAQRGRMVYESEAVGCAVCHPPGLFTNLTPHDVGTRGRFDGATERFDTPTLIEVWRTAPYLHDGSVTSIREMLTARNPGDRHGRTSQLSPAQLDDLVAYVLSL